MEAGEAGADYVAFGAFYPTTTKPSDYRPDPSILTWWSTLFEIPCVAIGGITPANARPLVEAGADFLAVCQAVWGKDDPAAAVKRFRGRPFSDPERRRPFGFCRLEERAMADDKEPMEAGGTGGAEPRQMTTIRRWSPGMQDNRGQSGGGAYPNPHDDPANANQTGFMARRPERHAILRRRRARCRAGAEEENAVTEDQTESDERPLTIPCWSRIFGAHLDRKAGVFVHGFGLPSTAMLFQT